MTRCSLLICLAAAISLSACARQEPHQPSHHAEAQHFASQLVQTLRELAEQQSDYDGGTVLGFGSSHRVEPGDQRTADESQFTICIDRYHEVSQQIGSGAGKQTQWDKYRGEQRITLWNDAASQRWVLLSTEFRGTRDIKPGSTYTDFTTRTVKPVEEIPQERELIEAALRIIEHGE